MPFCKEWRRLVREEGGTNRRLYETAGHRQLVVDGIAEGAMGRVAAGDWRDYAALATLVASAPVVNA